MVQLPSVEMVLGMSGAGGMAAKVDRMGAGSIFIVRPASRRISEKSLTRDLSHPRRRLDHLAQVLQDAKGNQRGMRSGVICLRLPLSPLRMQAAPPDRSRRASVAIMRPTRIDAFPSGTLWL